MPVLLAPPVRVRPAPPSDPPFDDESMVGAGHVDHPVVAALTPPSAQPALPMEWSTAAPRRAPGKRPARLVTLDSVARAGASSPVQAAAMRFVAACLEVMNGYRPVAHLRRLTAPAEFTAIAEEMIRALRRVSGSRGARPPTRSPAPSSVRLRDLRTCEPRDGAIEAAAVLGHGDRSWALALRLERRPAGWLCTTVRLV